MAFVIVNRIDGGIHMIKKITNICSHINYFMANNLDDAVTDNLLWICAIILACAVLVGVACLIGLSNGLSM